jgi:hypothetical protein
MAMSPEESLKRFQQRASAASGDYKAGIQRVSENPMEKAASRQDQYLAGIQEAVASGRWAAGLRSTSLEGWKAQASTKGASNFATGVQNLSARKSRNMVNNFRIVNAVAEQVRALPDVSFEDRINRMVAQVRTMRETKGQAKE